jgi:quercetin dioxygenase-like cupin family protein
MHAPAKVRWPLFRKPGANQMTITPDPAGFQVVRREAAGTSTPEPGLVRAVGASSRNLLLAEHRMLKGWVGARHQHPHEQLVYVVSGRLMVTIEQTSFEVRAGDSFLVPGGMEHQASALEDSLVVDVFTPCREEYL